MVSESSPVVSCCDLLGFLRLGAANMALCVFLSMKNTPLSILTATSHAEINVLHRIVGYAAGILVLAHAILYTVHFGIQDRWETLIQPGNIEGMGSSVAMVVLLLGTFRSRNYALFYLSHIAGFVASMVLTGLHRPDWAKKLPVVVLCIACIWAADRSIRAARSSYNAINNQVTLYPLPDGGTRLLVKKPSNRQALPGTHCYIWIPRLRLFHAHPFTVVSRGPDGLEFVAKSHKGFTKDLYGLATNYPGIYISRVFLDGPYGSIPDTSSYDKVVLIAGGSGGAFTFGLMSRILNHSSRISLQAIDFIWAVKRTGKPYKE
jgi:ferric-chelate reductase